MRFHFLTGDVNWLQYGGEWISNKLNNGDWDYFLVITLTNMHEATGEEDQPKYNVYVSAVSPEAAGIDKVNEALSDYGLPEDFVVTPEIAAEALHSYGIEAVLKQYNGNNAHALLREAREDANTQFSLMFGFFMDAPKNGLGSTGWDCIKGDIMAGLHR